MPNIPQLTSDVGGFALSDRGDQALNMAGRRVAQSYDSAGAAKAQTGARFGSAIEFAGKVAVEKIDQEQVAAGAADGARLFSNLNDSKDAAIKAIDPEDPKYGQKVEIAVKQWREQTLEPALEKFRGSFWSENSGKWAEHYVDQTREHMFISSAADISKASGIGIKNAVNETVTLASNTAARDPSSTQTQLDLLEHSINGMVEHSPIKGTAAAEVRSELLEKGKAQIVKSAAFGAIQKSADPVATAEEWTAKFPTLINGAEVRQLGQYAKAQQRANDLTEKQIAAYQKQQATEGAHEQLSKVFTDNVSFDENGKPSIKPGYFKSVMDTELKFPGAATERARSMINWAQAQQRERHEVINTNPTVRSDLYEGLFKTDKPTTDVDILKAAAEEKLDPHDTSTLLQLHKALEEAPLKGPIIHDTLAAVKDELVVNVPGLVGKDNVGITNYSKFMQTFIPLYQAKVRTNTLDGSELDVKDPNSMISKAMAPFRRTQRDRMNDFIAGAGGFTAGAEVALPAADKREVGKTYPTARGPMKWTGTGWVPGEPGAAAQRFGLTDDPSTKQLLGLFERLPINKEHWEAMLESSPMSEYIEDRRGDDPERAKRLGDAYKEKTDAMWAAVKARPGEKPELEKKWTAAIHHFNELLTPEEKQKEQDDAQAIQEFLKRGADLASGKEVPSAMAVRAGIEDIGKKKRK